MRYIKDGALKKELIDAKDSIEKAKVIFKHINEISAIYGEKAVSLFILATLGLPVPRFELIDVTLFDEFVKEQLDYR